MPRSPTPTAAHPFLDEVSRSVRGGRWSWGLAGRSGTALAALLPEAEVRHPGDLDLGSARTSRKRSTGPPTTWSTTPPPTRLWTRPRPLRGAGRPGRSTRRVSADWCEVARQHRLTLVHFSTDYVFDGTRELHDEDEPMSPLGVYGQSKAAGDALVSTLPRHYIMRTSWVVGDGKNFVTTMASLADQGGLTSVIDDQTGSAQLRRGPRAGRRHLTTCGAEAGTYNVTCSGDPVTWADIAVKVFEARGRAGTAVTPRQHRGVRRRQARRASAAPQHSGPEQGPRDRFRASGRKRSVAGLPRGALEDLTRGSAPDVRNIGNVWLMR